MPRKVKPTLLLLSIECGESTCASKPGKFCSHVSTSHFGKYYHCALFGYDANGERTALKEVDGWLQRHPKCVAAEGHMQDREELLENRFKDDL